MTIQDLKNRNLIIFEGVVGSIAYGIATPTSDVDIKGVFIQPLDDILSFGYLEQVNDEKNDTVYYEIRRFLHLIQQNNPNILELLNLPDDCILHKDPIFDLVLENTEQFISRICKYSFGGYAVEQIKKARGLNKKIVNPVEKERKSLLHFCYVPYRQGSIPVEEYLAKEFPNATYKDVGLVAIEHMRYTYGAYLRTPEEVEKYGYFKGIITDPETSNDVALSETVKGEMPKFLLQVNLDGYSVYCKKYKEYREWVAKRNPQRYTDNMLHGKQFDGKNMAHCIRLLQMALEIGRGEGINVRRNNREELLSIRRGEKDFDEIVSMAESMISELDIVYDNSSLPDKVDISFVNSLLLRIRKRRYNLS